MGNRSRGNVYGSAYTPVIDGPGKRADRRRFITLAELPPFAVAGVVDEAVASPAYPVARGCTVREIAVTVGTGGGPVDFTIRRGGITVASITRSTAGLSLHTVNFDLAVNDLVWVLLEDIGDGLLANLCIVMRTRSSTPP